MGRLHLKQKRALCMDHTSVRRPVAGWNKEHWKINSSTAVLFFLYKPPNITAALLNLSNC